MGNETTDPGPGSPGATTRAFLLGFAVGVAVGVGIGLGIGSMDGSDSSGDKDGGRASLWRQRPAIAMVASPSLEAGVAIPG